MTIMEHSTDSTEFLPQDVYEEYIRSSEYLKTIEEAVRQIEHGEVIGGLYGIDLEAIDWGAVYDPDGTAKPVLGADDCIPSSDLQYMNGNGVHSSFLYLYKHNGDGYEDFTITPPDDHRFSMYATSPHADDLSDPQFHGVHILYVPMPGVNSKIQKPFIVSHDVNSRVQIKMRSITDSYEEEHRAVASTLVHDGLAIYLTPDEISKISEIKRTKANLMLHTALLKSGQLL